MTQRSRRLAVVTILTLWASAAVGGMGVLMLSFYTADPPAAAQAVWPAALDLPRPPGEPTYVVCLHPRCPCSEATLDAFIQFLGSATNSNAYVLFSVPDGADDQWLRTDLIVRAREIEGLHVVIDSGGRRTAALGARTSGQTYLYDAAGKLVFTGGLTAGRGERGDCAGVRLLKDALAGAPLPARAVATPVFGCALYRPSPKRPA